MSEPKLAVDALLESDTTIAGLQVHPLTIARMALFELVESPLVKPGTEFTLPNMVVTAYIATASNQQLKGITSQNVKKLIEDAWEWADTVDISSLPEVVSTLMEKLQKAYKIAPGTGAAADESSKKNQ